MAHTSSIPRILLASTLLGSFALAAPVLVVPATARAGAPALGPAPTPDLAPGKTRLVMELKVDTTTDSTEPPVPFASNTEDEVYYWLTGGRVVGGQEATFAPKQVRPAGSRDIWEMGPNSNKSLVRTLFEGALATTDRATISVVVGEQDNAQREALKNLFMTIAFAGVDLLMKELINHDIHGAFKTATRVEIVDATMALVKAIGKQEDQVLGMFTVTASRGALKVAASGDANAKVVAGDATSATVKLSGYGGNYTVKLRLEDAGATPRPTSTVFLGEERDSCGKNDLQVSGKVLRKGQTVEVAVPDRRFPWRCGSTLEWTTAPAPTNRVKVTRAAEGRDILWRCLHAFTPAPDYVW